MRSSLTTALGDDSPYARLNWQRAQTELAQIARLSGGRMYSPDSRLDLASTYDGLFADLRVEYVIRYKSTLAADATRPRTVRVDLVDSKGTRELFASSLPNSAGAATRKRALLKPPRPGRGLPRRQRRSRCWS
jgi:hypothetical protein